jgi:hypothetical protein
MTQAQHTTERRDTDQVPDDSRARLLTRRKTRDRVILTQPPPPPPEPARPDRDDEESADDRLLAAIDEVLAQGSRERGAPQASVEGE